MFVQTGGALVIEGGTLSNGNALGGSGAGNGHGFGAGIFIQGASPTIALAPGVGQTLDVSDAIADQTGSDPTNLYGDPGSAQLVLSGAGDVILGAANSYSGGTSLQSGTLELAAIGAVGSGVVSFAGSATLRLDTGALGGTAPAFSPPPSKASPTAT